MAAQSAARLQRIAALATICIATAVSASAELDPSTNSPPRAMPAGFDTPRTASRRNWSVQIGVAYIARHNIGDILTGKFDEAEGSAGGEIYNLSFNWVAHRLAIPFRDLTLRPQIEPYVRLTLVDENSRSPFADYNAGFGVRWVDFPWNRWLKTTFFSGVGLSYSSKVFAADRLRHPDKHRSHLKFDWPLELTFALPRWPEHQIFVFNDHQSGGHVFDEAGVNSIGVGYRFEF